MTSNKPVPCCLSLFLVVAAVSSAWAENWPGWRGPAGTGVSADKDLPLKWSTSENVRWHVELPGPCHSSPIVWRDRVFVAQALDSGKRRTLMCFNRADGKLLWQSEVAYGESEPVSENNTYCAGTPATDGQRVYVCFGSAGVYAYDFDGKQAWRRDLGKLTNAFGTAVSPILVSDLCILNFGPDPKARLIALNKKTGEIAWEAVPPKPDESEFPSRGPGGPGGPGVGPGPGGPPGNRPGRAGPSGPGGDPARGSSWSTPIVVSANGRTEVVLATAGRLSAYDPVSGRQLWLSKGLGASIYSSPAYGEGVVFAMTSGPGGGPAIAVRPGGDGDVTESRCVWRLESIKSAIGSGVIHNGHLFLIGGNGVASCLDLKTGKVVWEEALRGTGGRGTSWSSMLLADGNIYVPNQSGDVFVFRAGPQFELLATNSLGEPTNASLAASNGELFMRTDKSLWCFANKP